MCGILGQINEKEVIDQQLFNSMRDRMASRGPDGAGSNFFQQGRVAIGHRRLSIIDLSEKGHQPMCNENGTIWIIYNGEVYNYQPLREELKQKGHRFTSDTDTEVLVHGYEEWGEDLPNHLEGMFAFGIWDNENQIFFLARDRFGIKPLYYASLNNAFFLPRPLCPS